MKRNIFELLCIIIISTYYPNSAIQAQTDYSAPFTLTVTSTGVNRFVTAQWSTITTSWSGSYQGLTYSFTLSKPSISLTNNSLRIILSLNITSSILNGTVVLTPTLTIPSTTLSADNIISQYENLHQVITTAANLIDSRLQYVIEQALSPINWIVYQGKILNASTTRMTETADISLKGLPTLTFSVAENELNLVVNSTFTATDPSISFQWMRSGDKNFGIRVVSNNLFTLGFAKIDDIIDQALGERIQFTLTSAAPPYNATYNTSLQKYTAEYTFQADRAVGTSLRLITKIYLKRGGMETIWTLSFIASASTSWTYTDTQVTAIRGE